MRKVMDKQMKLGEVDISKIDCDPRSRDEIPQLLRGLQHIYCTSALKEEVFGLLEAAMPAGKSSRKGRPGMDLWRILVLGTLRLNCNRDFDKLKEMADNHLTIREMLGHVRYLDLARYPMQTLRDNVSLLTPGLLEKINVPVVHAGHEVMTKKNGGDALVGRCDSFVVETDVHFPTDINLLLDAMRKVITLTARLCLAVGLSGWRQHGHNVKRLESLCLGLTRMKRSSAKDEKKKAERDTRIVEAHRAYLDVCRDLVTRVEASFGELDESDPRVRIAADEVRVYLVHARRQIAQTDRRVLNGETIPHDEKVFSVFEEHTEWISKGKAGTPVELGVRVCIMEDQYGFVLDHMVMWKKTDDVVAVPMVERTREHFPRFSGCSFDKGFYSPGNLRKLGEMLEVPVMPKKGRLSAADRAIEHSPEFIEFRHRHSAVESAINALENHGPDRCPDSGVDAFERYVALAVPARNIQQLGRKLLDRQRGMRGADDRSPAIPQARAA